MIDLWIEMFFCFSYLMLASHALLLASVSGQDAPPPNMGRPLDRNGQPYEAETNQTMDELITSAAGGINAAAEQMMSSPDGNIMAELDMLLTNEQFMSLYEELVDNATDSTNTARKKRKAAISTRLRWTDAKVPYVFTSGHFVSQEQYLMRRAMTEWERYTCMRFKPVTGRERNSLRFQNGQGCNSQLGMVGGQQILNLDKSGCRYKGLYLHEIGHALGLVHEHQLPDRDRYIRINYNNVSPAMRIWFNKYSNREVNQYSVPYEYSSVMHYGITAFSHDGRAQTISAFDKSKEAEIGKVYLKELAYSDVAVVNKMYNCAKDCPDKTKCGSNGHLDPNCNCICKDGSSDTCDNTKRQDTSCRNLFNSWSCYIWANQGECLKTEAYMTTNCARACNKCGTHTPRGSCTDAFPVDKCQMWRKRGDCITNKLWMKQNCASTCKLCSDAPKPAANCQNQHATPEKCPGWALAGECSINKQWMYDNCRSACLMCISIDGEDGGDEVTGTTCTDDNASCPTWASQGECNRNSAYMHANCKKSCDKCPVTTTPTTPHPTTTRPITTRGPVTVAPTACTNDNDNCVRWAGRGECTNNPEYMLVSCKKSCNNCPTTAAPTTIAPTTIAPTTISPTTIAPTSMATTVRLTTAGQTTVSPITTVTVAPTFTGRPPDPPTTTTPTTTTTTTTQGSCMDINGNCAYWAGSGECTRSVQYMNINCKMSCNLCGGGGNCSDLSHHCRYWARIGECGRNPVYMNESCKKSCQQC